MDNDAFLNGYGWVLPVFMAVGLFNSSLREFRQNGFAWLGAFLSLAIGVLVITLVLELPLSEDIAKAREVAFWVLIPCAPLGPLEAPCIGW